MVRAAFAYIEAFSFVFRQLLLAMILIDPKRGTDEVISEEDLQKIAMLLERIAVPANNGAINIQQQKTPLLNHLAFTLKEYEERFAIQEHFLGDNGWSQFQKSVKIRHRITHPKLQEDIEISVADLEIVSGAVIWFIHVSTKISNGMPTYQKRASE